MEFCSPDRLKIIFFFNTRFKVLFFVPKYLGKSYIYFEFLISLFLISEPRVYNFFQLINPRKYVFQHQSPFFHLCLLSLIFLITLQLKNAGISGWKVTLQNCNLFFLSEISRGFCLLLFYGFFCHSLAYCNFTNGCFASSPTALCRLFKPTLFLPCQLYFRRNITLFRFNFVINKFNFQLIHIDVIQLHYLVAQSN